MGLLATMTLVVLTLGRMAAAEQDATVPGDVTTPHPTILNLAVEWKNKTSRSGTCFSPFPVGCLPR